MRTTKSIVIVSYPSFDNNCHAAEITICHLTETVKRDCPLSPSPNIHETCTGNGSALPELSISHELDLVSVPMWTSFSSWFVEYFEDWCLTRAMQVQYHQLHDSYHITPWTALADKISLCKMNARHFSRYQQPPNFHESLEGLDCALFLRECSSTCETLWHEFVMFVHCFTRANGQNKWHFS